MRKIIVCLSLVVSFSSLAQQREDKTFGGGVLSLGARSTVSFFNEGGGSNGYGMGGQFRVQFAERVNSDWFFDYITQPVGELANRTDYHIGWSVLFYPVKHNYEKPALLKPYILAGHCFDYTNIRSNRDPNYYAERWSSAVQGGIGTHFNLTKRFDISLTSQYMIHLGNHVHVDEHLDHDEVHFEIEKGSSLEGHLLMTLSMNYKIADLW